MKFSFWIGGEEHRLDLVQKGRNEFLATIGGQEHRVFHEILSSREVLLNIDGLVHTVFIDSSLTSHNISVNGRSIKVYKKAAIQSLGIKGRAQQKKDVKTSMPGKIIDVLVKEGENVEEGQAVLILEAMKMQNEIKTPQSGRIARIFPKAGDSVEAGALLFSVK